MPECNKLVTFLKMKTPPCFHLEGIFFAEFTHKKLLSPSCGPPSQ